MIANIDEELKALLAYLEIEISEDAQKRIIAATSFETMRQVSPNHVRKGQSYKWMEQVTPEQNRRVLKQAGALLQALDYPLNPDENPSLPSLEHSSIEQFKAIAQQQTQARPFFKRAVRRVMKFLG